MFVVHQSTIKCYRRCKRQYYYQYILNIIKRRRSSPLLRGTVVHEMIENMATGKDPWEPVGVMEKEYAKLFDEEKDYYGDLPGDIKKIMTGYLKWYKKDHLTPIPLEEGGSTAEHKFQVQLTPSILLEGKIDQVGQDKAGHNWLVDHKTHKVLPQGDIKYSDIQSAIYVWALRQISKIKIYGVAWNYIRWKTPTTPEVLKNGEMSRRNIDTTWDVYRAALVKNKLDPADYQDMKKKLDGKEAEFFVRQYLPINETILNNLVEEAQITAREMKRKGGVDKTRTIDRHCQWCDYYVLCQAELRGLDTEWMMKNDYMEKPRDKAKIEVEDDE